MLRHSLAIAACLPLLGRVALAAPETPTPPAPAPTPTPTPTPDGTLPTGKLTEADLAKAARTDDRPWAAGVTPEQQRAALVLFNTANGQLRDALFVKAVETYRQALATWDHPAIHYNLALALVNLDQPVEMLHELEKAMAYGEAPLDSDKYDRAKGYRTLVEKQIAFVEYTLDVPGAVLTFDGTEVLVGPGTWTAKVRAGNHAVAAHADGYLPTQLAMKLGGGETSRLSLRLYTDADVTRFKRKYPTWLPWSVTGAGLAVAGAGLLLHRSAIAGYDAYDRAIRQCAEADASGGCSSPSPAINDERSRADFRQTLAFTAYGLGAVAVATGVTMLILNRPTAYRINPEAAAPLAVAPVVGAGAVGVLATGSF